MAGVELIGVRKSFGALEVIRGVDLDIKSGELVVFVGPSGCGKSTLLRLIAGLEEISGGTLKIEGRVVNDLPPARRGIAMVFQSYALYPHMTVYDNMAFGMTAGRGGKPEVDRRVREAAEMLQITPYLERLPRQLSGGQRQRVAIGRAIVRDPRVFLFDEPLSNLDAALRVATRVEIAKLHERMANTTMVYVTHDQTEAMTLADRIVVLRGGMVEQVGTPMELYDRPDNLFVAGFIGSPAMNMIPCVIEGGNDAARVKPSRHKAVDVHAGVPTWAVGMKATLGVRPENLSLSNGHGQPIFHGRLDIIEHLGEKTLLYVDCGYADPIVAKIEGHIQVERNAPLELFAPKKTLHVFDEKGVAFSPPAAA